MKNALEQTKQKIVLELEHARFWAACLIPHSAVLFTILFTHQYYENQKIARYMLALLEMAIVCVFILLRTRCLHRIKTYINKL
jgi:hypothetical protein